MTGAGPGVAETHVSTVFFAGDRAYKLLKPVDMGFLDYSTVPKRLEAARVELELNRRIAPDVYLGLADVVEDGDITDRFIVMKRLPHERRLSLLIQADGWETHLRAVARRVAQFHASLVPITGSAAAPAAAESVARNWRDNNAVLRDMGADGYEVAAIERLYERYILGRAALFEDRIRSGMVRDGHGDLTAEDTYCLEDGPRIIDCLAFDPALRIGDVLNDIGFLAMDVERLAGSDRAAALMRYYVEFSNEHHPNSLLDHYVAYRAQVRAKVASIRSAQGDSESAALAQQFLELCRLHLESSEVRMVLIGGGPGTGKTTLAERLSAELGWVVLGSDSLRKDLAGRAHGDFRSEPFGEGIYDAAHTAATYEELLDRAEYLLGMGQSVILDASWSTEEQRMAARLVGDRTSTVIHELQCVLPVAEAERRVAARASCRARVDASDATAGMVGRSLAERDPWPAATRINGVAPLDRCVAAALAEVSQRH